MRNELCDNTIFTEKKQSLSVQLHKHRGRHSFINFSSSNRCCIIWNIRFSLKSYPDTEQDFKNKIINSFSADNNTHAGIEQVNVFHHKKKN